MRGCFRYKGLWVVQRDKRSVRRVLQALRSSVSEIEGNASSRLEWRVHCRRPESVANDGTRVESSGSGAHWRAQARTGVSGKEAGVTALGEVLHGALCSDPHDGSSGRRGRDRASDLRPARAALKHGRRVR